MCATKSDLAELRAEAKAGIANLKAYFAESKTSTIMWVVTAIFLAQLLPVVVALVREHI
jgi:hypothetical protein